MSAEWNVRDNILKITRTLRRKFRFVFNAIIRDINNLLRYYSTRKILNLSVNDKQDKIL